MATAVPRAWHFTHPDLDAGAAWSGIGLSPRGGIAVAEGADAVRQGLLLLLTTVPGERVMRPDYGCDLHRLVFAPNDASTAGLAIHYVRRAVQRFEPRVDVLDVDADAEPDAPSVLGIRLRYRIRSTARVDELGIRVDLAGSEG
jgi:phage baseplate assembly protein W